MGDSERGVMVTELLSNRSIISYLIEHVLLVLLVLNVLLVLLVLSLCVATARSGC
jgi:hypothetical protein